MKVGIDTVTAVVPIRDADLSGLVDARRLRATECDTGQVNEVQSGVLSSGLNVRTQALRDGRARLVVSGSVPKSVHGHNLEALHPSALGPVLRDVVVPELETFTEGLDVEGIVFSRFDTVTDLDCAPEDIGPLLSGLSTVPVRKGVRSSLLRSTVERPETLWRQNKGGGLRCYDKALEATIRGVSKDLLHNVGSRLRVENQAMRDWVKACGVRELRDVERFPENVVSLHQKRVAWAGVDRGVVTLSTWVDELVRYCNTAGVSPVVRNGVVGYALMVAHGHEPGVHRNSSAIYRKILRESGIHPADTRQPATCEVTYELDFEAGRVVRRVA